MARFLVASDHAGLALKAEIVAHLLGSRHDVVDLGTTTSASCDYPDFAFAVARRVAAAEGEDGNSLGILVCGTGQGMAMTANRVPGARAAVCSDTFSVRATRQHNIANVLCLGQRVIGVGLALEVVDAFLSTAFEGGRHQRRIEKFDLPARSP